MPWSRVVSSAMSPTLVRGGGSAQGQRKVSQSPTTVGISPSSSQGESGLSWWMRAERPATAMTPNAPARTLSPIWASVRCRRRTSRRSPGRRRGARSWWPRGSTAPTSAPARGASTRCRGLDLAARVVRVHQVAGTLLRPAARASGSRSPVHCRPPVARLGGRGRRRAGRRSARRAARRTPTTASGGEPDGQRWWSSRSTHGVGVAEDLGEQARCGCPRCAAEVGA